jgi:hypothetical protein
MLIEKLPWHIKYLSFDGTLPRISGIEVVFIGAQFLVEWASFTSCLFTTSAASPARGLALREPISSTITGIGVVGTIRSNSAFCPAAELSGTSGTVTDASGLVNMTVALVT